MRRIRDLSTMMAVTVLLAACGGEAAKSEPAAAPKTSYTCKVFIAKKVGKFTADASDPDPAKAEEAAWTAVCAKLPEAERAGCRDDKKFSVQKVAASASAGGPTTHSVTLTLEGIAPELDGEGASDESKEKACAAATEAACAKAGEKGDCLAAGGYDKKGESTSKKTVRG